MQCPKLACHQVQEDICDVTKLNIIIKEIDSKKGKGKLSLVEVISLQINNNHIL